jgi:SSS family solute:Na+ symporter
MAPLGGYGAVSLMARPTGVAVLAAWRERLAGRPPELASEPVAAPQ